MKFAVLMFSILGGFSAFAGTATYKVTIESNWSRAEHLDLPGNAHFSPVVAVAHNSKYALLPIGAKAGEGLEDVAEMGRTGIISTEISKKQSVGKVGALVITQNQFVQRQPVQEFEVEVSEDHPYLSFVSMIAPSPDWVIGVSGLKLKNKTTGFTEKVERRRLYAIDAGTESGDFGGNFSLNNPAERPQKMIGQLTGRGFQAPFAFVTIERIR